MIAIELTARQNKIIDIVRATAPITSSAIAEQLGLSRAAIRPELSILTMANILSAKPRVGYVLSNTTDPLTLVNAQLHSKVADVCSVPIVVDEKVSVYDAIVTMFLEDVGSIIVLSGGYLAGMVSRKDFIQASMGGGDIHSMPVGVIMTRMPNIYLTYPTESIVDAARRIIHHKIDGLPVVEKETTAQGIAYRVIGKISKTTITRLFVELTDTEQTEANA